MWGSNIVQVTKSTEVAINTLLNNIVCAMDLQEGAIKIENKERIEPKEPKILKNDCWFIWQP